MSKFNTGTIRPARGSGPMTAAAIPSTRTFEGAPAHARDLYSELFLLGVSNMVGADTFYEAADARDARFAGLVRQMAVADIHWLIRFVRWLRAEGNMRSASLVAAAQGVHARLEAGLHGDNRRLIDAALQRADEPGEMLAYWHMTFGRALPKPVKRGIADAALRLYGEFALLKYDTDQPFRFGDVLELTHPGDRSSRQRLRGPWQGDLFKHALDRRHRRDNPTPETLRMLRANEKLRAIASSVDGDLSVLLDADRLRAAGMTWEAVLSLAGSKLPKKRLWDELIPVMGIFALARNLRNFDQAGVDDVIARHVIDRFTDPEQVTKSRMLPFRWLSAYEAAPSLRWGHALDLALQASLANIPSLPGRTLILVDTSASMTKIPEASKSKVTPLTAAAVFGVALAAKGEQVDLHGFASRTFRHTVGQGASVIAEVHKLVGRSGEVGHQTLTAEAVKATFRSHDRVFIISDEQTVNPTSGDTRTVPAHVPVYAFNLNGYAPAMLPIGSPNRIQLGGLTDATFAMVPLIEAGRKADWPF